MKYFTVPLTITCQGSGFMLIVIDLYRKVYHYVKFIARFFLHLERLYPPISEREAITMVFRNFRNKLHRISESAIQRTKESLS